MNVGDLVKIVTSVSEVFAIIVDDTDPTGWLTILDQNGNILWWPPVEMISLTSNLEVINKFTTF